MSDPGTIQATLPLIALFVTLVAAVVAFVSTRIRKRELAIVLPHTTEVGVGAQGLPEVEEFEDELAKLSGPLETFMGVFGKLSYQFSIKKDITPPDRWKRIRDGAPFPFDEATTHPNVIEFSRLVYTERGAGDAEAFYRNCPLAVNVTVDEFRDFNGARRALSQFLEKWERRFKVGTPERQHAHKRVSDPSTLRAIKSLTYLEIALTEALGNQSPLISHPGWYRWACELFAPASMP